MEEGGWWEVGWEEEGTLRPERKRVVVGWKKGGAGEKARWERGCVGVCGDK